MHGEVSYRDRHPTAERDRRTEGPVDAAGADGDHPRGEVGSGGRRGPVVPGAAGDDDAAARRMQRSDGYAVLVKAGLGADGPDGDAEHTDAVSDGVVDGGEHVGLEAGVLDVGVGPGDGPADLVGGEAGEGGAAGRGGAACKATEGCSAWDGAAGGGGGGVSAVAVVVAGRAVGVRGVQRAVVGLVCLQVVSRSDQLPVSLLAVSCSSCHMKHHT